MFFDPHSQIQEESGVRLPLGTSTTNFSALSTAQPPFSLFPIHAKPEDGPLSNSFDTARSSQDISNVCVSYDIYGNELSLEEEDIPRVLSHHDLELESIKEEDIMCPDGMGTNQENNDPLLGVITPLKKRRSAIERARERGRSFALTRSPLLDITPSVPKRKGSHQIDTRIDRVLLFNTTPINEAKQNTNDIALTRKLR